MAGRRVSFKQIKQDYFAWLCELVGVGDGDEPFYILAKELHATEFTWCVRNDDNRASDGLQLRAEYGNSLGYFDGPCSVLEMLIALARRIDFELSSPDNVRDYTSKYFWKMIANLGLTDYNDNDYMVRNKEFPVANILRVFLQRQYCSNGEGGLFPLHWPGEDQREVEIWYQMNAWVEENYS